MHDVAINPLCGKVIRFRSRSSVPRQPHLGVRIVLRAQHEVMAAMGAALRGGVIRPAEMPRLYARNREFFALHLAIYALPDLSAYERSCLEVSQLDIAWNKELRALCERHALLEKLAVEAPANRVTRSTRKAVSA